MADYETETVRRVHWIDCQACIEVGPDGDGMGCVEIRTVGEKNEEAFGKVRLSLPVAYAKLLAQAILDAADEATP